MALKKLPGGVVYETDGGARLNEEAGVNLEAIHRQLGAQAAAALAALATKADIKALDAVRATAQAAQSTAHDARATANAASSVAGSARTTAGNAVDRVTALESAAGFGPSTPVDGQTASLVLQPDTQTRAAVGDAVAAGLGVNLYRPTGLVRAGIASTVPPSVWSAGTNRGVALSVTPGDAYTVSRLSSAVADRLVVGFTKEYPASGAEVFGRVSATADQNSLTAITVPSGVAWMLVMVSASSQEPGPLDVKIERGPQATRMSKAPEVESDRLARYSTPVSAALSVRESGESALRSAITSALQAHPDRTDLNRAVYLPAGVYDIRQPRFLSTLDREVFGASPGIRKGLKFIGDGKSASVIRLVTEGSQKWLYDNESTSNRRFMEMSFQGISFQTDDPELGDGFNVWSAGGDKRFRFTDCDFNLGTIMSTHGTGNADLNRWLNCLITAHRALLVLDNNQSVAHGFSDTDVALYRDGIVVKAGGNVWWRGGNFEMHPHATDAGPHFMVRTDSDPDTGPGNNDIRITDVRAEIHGAGKGLARLTGHAKPMDVVFTNFLTATVSGTPLAREAVYVEGGKRVAFRDSQLHPGFTFRAATDRAAAPMGALIDFRDTDPGNGASLASRCSVSGLGRILSNGAHRKAGDTIRSNPSPDDFDLGWEAAPRYAPLPAVKTMSLKYRSQVLPSTSGTGDWNFTLPPGALIRRIYIYRAGVAGKTGTYGLSVGTADRSKVIASAAPVDFATPNVIDMTTPTFTPGTDMAVWATGTLGAPGWSGGSSTVAIVEYI